ncbi:MAG: twin-arginine translocase TatA/TatE family subunit [Acidobacteriota bacterium]|nr:twin-arginine translocase TatA/TatE family subunit [Blastocatellia bacterium]MDW8238207.1 twin-arginine translocase TatA/TatE family subunit [Acidobacteriota bacterium]
MGFPELLIILVIVLLLFGARRLPEIGGSLGRAITEFKRGLHQEDNKRDEPDKPVQDTNETTKETA